MSNRNYVLANFRRGLLEILDILQLLEGRNAYIAGGYARWCVSPRVDSPLPSDIDIFVPDFDTLVAIEKDLVREGFGLLESSALSKTWVDANTHRPRPDGFPINTIQPKIFEGRTLDTRDKYTLLDSFPFSVTRALIISADTIIIDSDLIAHENSKMVVLEGTSNPDPASAILHAFKYVRKGYGVIGVADTIRAVAKQDAKTVPTTLGSNERGTLSPIFEMSF